MECSSWCCGLVLISKRGHLQKFPSKNFKLLNVVWLKLLYYYTEVLLEWLFCLPGWTFVQPYVGWSIISKLLKLHENLWWSSFLSMVHGEYPLLRQVLLKFFCKMLIFWFLAMIKQFLSDVCWGELDYLVIDTPPGIKQWNLSCLSHNKISFLFPITIRLCAFSTYRRNPHDLVRRGLGSCNPFWTTGWPLANGGFHPC